jgi:thiamine biosynthesis lipoprotein
MLQEHRFRAMNTAVAAWLWTDSPLAGVRLDEVERCFAQVEAELSRFRPQSGLSRLNAAAGHGPQPISPMLEAVLALALEAARTSGGIFDPTVLNALHRAGYDRSFEHIETGGASPHRRHKAAASGSGWRQVQLDRTQGTATLPVGLGIDLGGIAKGWAVDEAARQLGQWGPALVDAGGDIRSLGTPGVPWPVAVQDPFDETRDLVVVSLADSAVATSSIGGRRWQRNGQPMHHLIDPHTGQPGRSDLHTVTALAPTAVEAEVTAKVVLLLGRQEGQRYAHARGHNVLCIGHDGQQSMAGDWLA